jgi:hypothetical protein
MRPFGLELRLAENDRRPENQYADSAGGQMQRCSQLAVTVTILNRSGFVNASGGKDGLHHDRWT